MKETAASIRAFITTNPIGRVVGIVSAVVAVTTTIVTINKKIEEQQAKVKGSR